MLSLGRTLASPSIHAKTRSGVDGRSHIRVPAQLIRSAVEKPNAALTILIATQAPTPSPIFAAQLAPTALITSRWTVDVQTRPGVLWTTRHDPICCLPGQIGVQPAPDDYYGKCVPGTSKVPATSLATKVGKFKS